MTTTSTAATSSTTASGAPVAGTEPAREEIDKP